MPKSKIKLSREHQLSEAFSPSAPVTSKDCFYGRYEQLKKVDSAINEKGEHIIMYGERGVGKTSIANVIEQEHEDGFPVKITCTRNNTFQDIWTEILRAIKYAVKFSEDHTNKKIADNIDIILSEKKFDFQAVLYTFSKINDQVLIILDEFDLIQKNEELSKFADSIKSFSDNLPHVTMMLVGVAENITQLIGEHASIERCLLQIHIPVMHENELSDIIDGGLMKINMKMEPSVKNDIITFSRGFPHYAHLLAKHSVMDAINKKYNAVIRINFNNAVNETIENAFESIRFTWQKAVSSNQSTSLYESVVLACALVKEDEHNSFRASDLLDPIERISGRKIRLKSYSYHLSKLCQKERGSVLKKIPIGRINRYKLKNPMFKAFLMLKLYKKGILKKR